MLAILSKEFKSYFYSATAYIFMGVFLFFSGIFFTAYNAMPGDPNYSGTLGTLMFIFLLIAPILTMRTMADENREKTDQLLFTSPQRISSIIIGKYFAALALFFITLSITVLQPLMLSIFGRLDGANIFATYLGFFLMGASFLAIGIFFSSLTDSLVVAGVSTWGVLLLLWITSTFNNILPNSAASGLIFALLIVVLFCTAVYFSTRNIVVTAGVFAAGALIIVALYLKNKVQYEGFISKFFGWFSILERNQPFANGAISVNSVIYFISFAFVFIFLTIRVIEKRRWS